MLECTISVEGKNVDSYWLKYLSLFSQNKLDDRVWSIWQTILFNENKTWYRLTLSGCYQQRQPLPLPSTIENYFFNQDFILYRKKVPCSNRLSKRILYCYWMNLFQSQTCVFHSNINYWDLIKNDFSAAF